jgi:hypothetical protein
MLCSSSSLSMRVVGIMAFLLFSFFTRVKPHHLLQKCSFFLIKLAASAVALTPDICPPLNPVLIIGY